MNGVGHKLDSYIKIKTTAQRLMHLNLNSKVTGSNPATGGGLPCDLLN